ncbi:MAG: hypothetical protein KKD01_07565 [Proteobacteria bacterium]|nr:hypothetical protein [Pseudomonadota bacterium]MBU1420744.1 hypothetical protein [Pseudomonadota bacterium]MBU1454574.1 hypothetical protein [Pseudomonadota bacterium]
MKNRNFLILLAILLVAGGTLFFLPNDEKKIRRNLASLADYCSSSREEGSIETLKKAALSAKLCSNPCRIQVKSFNINRDFNKKDISDHILMMKKMLANTRFDFHDTVIDFPDDDRAEIMTTLRLEGKTKDNRFTDAYEMNITVTKSEGDWFFSSFTVVEFIEQ